MSFPILADEFPSGPKSSDFDTILTRFRLEIAF